MDKRIYTHTQILLLEMRATLSAGIMPRPKGRPHKDAPSSDMATEHAYGQSRKTGQKMIRFFKHFGFQIAPD